MQRIALGSKGKGAAPHRLQTQPGYPGQRGDLLAPGPRGVDQAGRPVTLPGALDLPVAGLTLDGAHLALAMQYPAPLTQAAQVTL